MRKLFVLLILPLNALVQNLVPNPSFEGYQDCPSMNNVNIIPFPWLSPTNGSVDFFHACADNYRGVPYHGIDFQYAKTGDGYVGMWFYNGGGGYREYLQVKLIDSLDENLCYYIEFNLNLAAGLKYGLKNAYAHFSSNQINSTGTGYVLELEPHVSWFRDDYITDTMNWTKISGIYTAIGGEEYITIGNFFNDAETDTLFTGFGTYHGAYYYIDDISVIPIDSLPNEMPAYAGEDVLLNPGDSIFIGQDISNLNCTWRTLDGTVLATNTSGIYVQPTETTTYVVEQNLCGNVTFDTVVVSVGYVGVNESSPIPLPSADGGKFEIYPNPNNGTFTLKTYSLEIKELKLIDEIGRQLQILDPKSNVFNLNLPKGVYFLEINCEGHQVVEKMVIN